MRAYVTGGEGFVGSWLTEHLGSCGDVVHASRCDVTDAAAVLDDMTRFGPDAVYHLAALAAVGDSWSAPHETVRVNVMGSQSVLDAARRQDPMPRVVFVSSADVYGRVGHDAAITESSPVLPDSPYAGSKAAAERLAAQHFLGYGLPVIVVRPFNHIGPRQSDAFLVSALAKRVAEAELHGADRVPVGNLDAERDFTDVRDVVRAYRLLVERGVAGQTYNVCSGVARSARSIAEIIAAGARTPVHLVTDPALLRPVDARRRLGSAERLREETGWEPRYDVTDTVRDVLDWWRARIVASGRP
jgi:GDP-4-dehydro-6-deoxy-D-mannose reductase